MDAGELGEKPAQNVAEVFADQLPVFSLQQTFRGRSARWRHGGSDSIVALDAVERVPAG